MRLPAIACLLLLSPAPALGSELTVNAVAGGDMLMAAGVGYGNLFTPSLWGMVPDTDRRLESFTINAAQPTSDAAYRLAVCIMTDSSRWGGDVFTTGWQTDGTLTAAIDGGLSLDPALRYIAYLVPQTPGWTLGTTMINGGPGVVGVALLFYTDSLLIDGDLPHDRDVAMHATFSAIPEPSTFALVALGLAFVWWRH